MKKLSGKSLGLVICSVIAFTGAFMILLIKQRDDLENILADVNRSALSLSMVTEKGKQIVVKDNYATFNKYYVVYYGADNNYIIHVHNFYDSKEQYKQEFNNYSKKIVDYNEKDLMIRYSYGKGQLSYDDMMSNLSSILDLEDGGMTVVY